MGEFKEALLAKNFAYAGAILHGLYADGMYEWNKEKSQRDGKFHASSLMQPKGEFCHLEHVLDMDYERVEADLPISLLKVFQYGWEVHINHQEVMTFKHADEILEEIEKKYEYTIDTTIPEAVLQRRVKDAASRIILKYFKEGMAKEVETSHDYPVWEMRFTPDALIELDEVEMPWEIKGFRDSEYQLIAGYDPYRSADYTKAVIQANLYMYLLGLQYAGIFIENKANQQYLIRVVEYDPELAEPYIHRAEVQMKYRRLYRLTRKHYGLEQIQLPQRICQSIEEPRARKCPLREVCFAHSWKEREQWRKKGA